MNQVAGGVTAPEGFLASGTSVGIKRRGKDLALIFSKQPAVAAGTLTQNRLKAPCVLWAHELLRRGVARAIVANSGNANCCTGRRGIQDNAQMARWVGEALGIKSTDVFVASTGVIGRPVPMNRIRRGISEVVGTLNRLGSLSAAEAIMTTDTRPKEIAVRWEMGNQVVTLGGIAKGAGMIAPSMATLFGFLTTDARVDRSSLTHALRLAVEESFNAISVDGEMSTNDMVLILANGASGAPLIRKGSPFYPDFLEALKRVCAYLAHEIVRDGEGVTRLMNVRVTGAVSRDVARQVARTVGESLLVKTMVAGRDPNWGRIAAAVGASGVLVDSKKLTIRLGNTVVFHRAEPARVRHESLLKEVDQPEVQIGIDLGQGSATARLFSGDLTEGYIRINAKYTT